MYQELHKIETQLSIHVNTKLNTYLHAQNDA